MKRFSLRAFSALSVSALLLSCLFGIPAAVHAQTSAPTAPDVGLTQVGSTVHLSGTDPRVIVVRIINVALSLIAIILVCIILYAGFLWMTSGGDPEKTAKAKKYIQNAIIGVIIILSAWAITKFILNALVGATTNSSGGTSTSQGTGRGGSFGSAGISGGFVLQGVQPEGSAPRNAVVRFLFSDAVNPEDVNANLHVFAASTTTPVAGGFTVAGSLVTFTPSSTCPAPNADRYCFDAFTAYTTHVDPAMRSQTGQVIACGGLGAVCEGHFVTTDQIDVTPPTVTLLAPYDGQSLPQNQTVEMSAAATDDSGVSLLEFSADGRVVGRTTPTDHQTPTSFTGTANWDTAGVSLGIHHLSASALDDDSNRGQSASSTVIIRSDSCFNGIQDTTETGIDCGGTCGACAGGQCTVGTDCASGVCSAAGVCVDRPIITGITPNNGRVGTIVTISGANFGTAGTVVFTGGVQAHVPSACTDAGSGWSDTAIIIEVPVGAQTGPITVTNTGSNLSDASNDDVGPNVGVYTVNQATHPGLCAITPDHGAIGTAATLQGADLGTASDRVRVGDAVVTAFRGWTDSQILLNIPSIPNGTVSVTGLVGDQQTNPVPFSVEATQSTAPPVIDAISPTNGPVGEYITISGHNFGTQAGSVRIAGLGGAEGDADTTFPAACDQATRYWTDTSITIKVPASLRGTGLGATVPVTAGGYQLYVQRQDGSAPSNRQDLTVRDGQPDPGLCAVSPDVGPVGTEITLTGERFGTDQGQVTFSGSGHTVDSSSIVEWTDQTIRATVPAGATTGAVLVHTHNQSSNPRQYTVRIVPKTAPFVLRRNVVVKGLVSAWLARVVFVRRPTCPRTMHGVPQRVSCPSIQRL